MKCVKSKFKDKKDSDSFCEYSPWIDNGRHGLIIQCGKCFLSSALILVLTRRIRIAPCFEEHLFRFYIFISSSNGNGCIDSSALCPVYLTLLYFQKNIAHAKTECATAPDSTSLMPFEFKGATSSKKTSFVVNQLRNQVHMPFPISLPSHFLLHSPAGHAPRPRPCLPCLSDIPIHRHSME